MCLQMDLLEPITTLVAAFAGAWAAFLFESRKRKSEELERYRNSANQALATLSNMWNIMFQYHRTVVHPILGCVDAWLNMAATPLVHYGLSEFDSKSLSFLIDVGEPQVFMEITLEEQRFWGTIHLIEERNAVLLNAVYPAMSSAKLAVNSQLEELHLISIIGIDATQRLRNLTPAIAEQVKSNCASHVTAFQALRQTMKKLYPDMKFLSAEFKPLENST